MSRTISTQLPTTHGYILNKYSDQCILRYGIPSSSLSSLVSNNRVLSDEDESVKLLIAQQGSKFSKVLQKL